MKNNRKLRPSQGFWGTGQQRQFFQGNREKKPKNKVNRGTRAILGNTEIKILFLGNKDIFSRGTREQVPLLGPKIKFYMFAIAYLPTLLPPTQLFFCFSRTNFFFFFCFFDISVSV